MSGRDKGEMLRYCRQCMIRDMDDETFFRNLHAYMAQIPQEQKVSEAVYEERLTICMNCDHLLAGMCRICPISSLL